MWKISERAETNLALNFVVMGCCVQTEEIGSLFKLRATALGDGNTILAASWLHILGDGNCHIAMT